MAVIASLPAMSVAPQSSARVHEAVLSELRDQLAHRHEILLADLPGSVSEVYVNR